MSAQDMRVTLRSSSVEVDVLPTFGARVVALVDRRSGRNWLAIEGQSAGPRDDHAFGVEEAAGWDECFPTVAPWDASKTTWRRRLRDHGELWGRAWTVKHWDDLSLGTVYEDRDFSFARELALDEAQLTATYRVQAIGNKILPALWSMHALLALAPGERIEIPRLKRVDATYLTLGGRTLSKRLLNWPDNGDSLPFPLDRVQPTQTRFSGKFYAEDASFSRASVGGENGWLDFEWEGVDYLGLWMTYGGWPQPNDILHVAIEPTNAPADHLGGAIATERALRLTPGEPISWRVALTLRPPSFPARS
jgi:galactose mutarotase-like enzyme